MQRISQTVDFEIEKPVSFCGVYEAKLEYHYEACAAVNIFLPSTPLYQQISRHLSEKSIVCC